MRTTIGITGAGRIVLNLYNRCKRDVDCAIGDRQANGDAFAGERAVRLPRRLGVDCCHVVSGQYLRARRHPNGQPNHNVI